MVVNFFASWCVPCIAEHPELVSFSEAHRRSRDASVVSVASGDAPTAARQFFEKRGGDWPVLVKDTDPFTVAYGVIKVPETFIVAPNGLIVAKFSGAVTAKGLDNVIQQLTNTPTTR